MNKKNEKGQAIATTPMQSKLLTTYGVPESSADMRWNRKTTMKGEMILEPFNPSEPPILYEGQPAATPSDYIPAWSLGKLVDIYGGVLNLNDASQLRAYLVDTICQMMTNGGGNLAQSKPGE